MYTVLGILFLFLVYREIEHGPGPDNSSAAHASEISAAAD